ncbi:beta strand repeat-containing protein [Nostoc sp. DSM 114167]|jgi:filamentous hemagglutinin family protein|uniref:beta strand repeat-containing protein n=1 Tax=Nostoc sp. DSM 114167 TaxID=3439050 RepID=UPI0040452ACE
MAIYGNKNFHSNLLEVFSIIGVLAHGIFYYENHALAQITPDGTLGNNSSIITPNVNIKGSTADRIDGGVIRGANLFHSFQEFNVGELQRVYFANPTGISNILTRVTGSNISNILGTLGVDGGANLFLINPNGIFFGKNARLDVAGSFVGSTANSFVFGNGLEFSATNPQTPSPLLTVNPSALFFNQIAAAPIQNNSVAPAGIDPAGFNAFGLRVGDGKSLLLVGGNVSMDGGQLNAYGGRVELGGLAAPGNVNLLFNGDNLSLKFPLNVTRADVSLTNEAFVYVEAAGGGDIAINARNIDIVAGSQLSAGIGFGLGQPEATAGDITLNATGEIKVADSGSGIRNFVSQDSKGNGGNIFIDSGDFSLRDSAQLSASTYGEGNAGNVTVSAKDAVDLANGSIFSSVEAGGVGKGGNININATTLSLTDGAQLLTITRGASATQPAGRGDAGNLNVQVTGAVDISGEKNDFFSVISSVVQTGTIGNGGNIFIDSGDFSLKDGAQLSASTYGVGNAGNVTVRAKNAISLANGSILSIVEAGGVGKAGNIDINATTLSLTDGTQLVTITRGASATQPAGRGNGGNIFIDSGDFSLSDGAGLIASTYGEGNAGNVTVRAKNAISLANGSIFSTVEAGGVGKGGNIDINATTLSLTDGAQLLTITSRASATQPAGRGDAGNVNVQVTGAVDISGEKNDFFSVISSVVQTGTIGNGGSITIDSGNFSLSDGAGLIASTYGEGNAGNVTVRAKNAVDLVANGGIFSTVEAGGVGKGGNININATTLSLTDGARLLTITSRASATQPAGRGDAGNVNVQVTGAVDISGEKNDFFSVISSVAQTGTIGNGGSITIDSGNFSLSDGAQLQASTSGVGNAGNVTVRAKNAVDLANSSIFSTVEAGGVGKGGNIDINATTLSLTDGAQLLTSTRGASLTQPAGRGNAGNVNVKVTGAVDISGEKNDFFSGIRSNVETGTVGNGGSITIDSDDFSLRNGASLSALTSGVGNAGNVTVNAKNAVDLANGNIFSTVEAGGVGKGGNIDINATTLSLTDGAQLLTSTRGASATQPAGRGDAGNVNVQVTGRVDIAGEKNDFLSVISSNVETGTIGNGGSITIDSGDFSLRDGAQLIASTSGVGNAGNVTVGAKNVVTVSGTSQESGNSSALFTFTDSTSTGIGGDITINTNIFRISDGALLDARTRNNQQGGDITVNANIFEALNGGQLTTTTSSNGRAGKITVNADDRLIINGIDPSYSDRTTNFPDNVLTIGANSGLFVSSTGSGITGDIEINSPKFTLDNQGKLNAESASGNGGNINVNSDLLLLRRNSQISTNAGTEKLGGNGGNIKINSRFIVAVPKENSDISANAFTGTGGRVDITTNGIFGILPQKRPTENSDITASSELGVSGEVTINSPDTDPSRGLIQLPYNLVDVSQQITQGCTPRGGQNASSFIATGRGGLPQSPNEPLRGRAVITGWVDLPAQVTHTVTDKSSTATMTKSSNPIVEAQGWIVDANGNIMLVAQSGQSSFIPSAISCSQ